MSKLYDTYISLKANKQNTKDTLYLFKSGIFFICLDADAKKASEILKLKLTNLNENVVKCGFPINSLNKYSNLLKLSNYKFEIIDTSKKESFTVTNYFINDTINNLLLDISNIDTDNLSVKEAYEFIDALKQKAILILGGNNYYAK